MGYAWTYEDLLWCNIHLLCAFGASSLLLVVLSMLFGNICYVVVCELYALYVFLLRNRLTLYYVSSLYDFLNYQCYPFS